VDKTAPEIEKIVGDNKVECDPSDPNECDYYINQNTPITFNCQDVGDHPSNDVTIYWNIYLEGASGWELNHEFSEQTEQVTWSCHEDSRHMIEYWCEDAVGKKSPVYTEIDVVETVGPKINKTIEDPNYGDCTPEATQNPENECYVDTETYITIDPVDPQPHPVGGVECRWTYAVGQEAFPQIVVLDWIYEFPITFPEESYHTLIIECEDALGNITSDTEYFIVDKTPPIIDKSFGEPYFTQDDMNWITSDTPIYVSAYDPEPHPSGLNILEYRTTRVDDEACRDVEVCHVDVEGSGDFTPMENGGNFTIGEESCHLIEIFAEDNVDKNSLHKQCVFVDDTPPNPVKTVGEPSSEWHPEIGCEYGDDSCDPPSIYYEIEDLCWNGQGDSIDCWKVTLLTPVSLDCEDPLPHPVDHESTYFIVDLDGDDVTSRYCDEYDGILIEDGRDGEDWCYIADVVEFFFLEETEHNLKYYCEDALGNVSEEIDDEKFKVEGTAFEIQINKKWNLI